MTDDTAECIRCNDEVPVDEVAEAHVWTDDDVTPISDVQAVCDDCARGDV